MAMLQQTRSLFNMTDSSSLDQVLNHTTAVHEYHSIPFPLNEVGTSRCWSRKVGGGSPRWRILGRLEFIGGLKIFRVGGDFCSKTLKISIESTTFRKYFACGARLLQILQIHYFSKNIAHASTYNVFVLKS